MNKHILTNAIALIIVIAGFLLDQALILSLGLFALSGAVTNWLAIHMLFEKVPLLYGSGVIPEKFEQFKEAIRNLFMTQFFTKENIEKLLSSEDSQLHQKVDFRAVIEGTDLNPAYDSLVNVVENSQFGAMLGMFGGTAALEPLKEPFIKKMQSSLIEISESDVFNHTLKAQLTQTDSIDSLHKKITEVIDARLSELTPALVKELVQQLIKEHLGWLVVWGGVFGGAFGVIAHFI